MRCRQVVLADHSAWKARLVGASPEGDLAVLAIDVPEDRLQPIRIGTSRDLEAGQSVFAIGNRFGFAWHVPRVGSVNDNEGDARSVGGNENADG